MIVNSSQNVQSSNPLGSISSRRVTGEFRSSNIDPEDKKAQQAQQQQNNDIVRQLRSRDREVRAHESAHVAAGGSLVRGGPSFTYQTGPDGRSYAIGGEVQIDSSAVPGDPEATLIKSGQIRAAALAPANPSSQDLRVASNANQLASQARVDIAVQRREDTKVDDQPASDSVESTKVDGSNKDEADIEAGSDSNSVASSSAAPDAAPVVSSASVASSVTVQSRDEPAVAAISSFMTPAQAVTSSPSLFSLFA